MIYGAIQGLSKPLPRTIFGTLPLVNTDATIFSLLDSVTEMGCYAFDTAMPTAMELQNRLSEIGWKQGTIEVKL